MVVGGVYTRKIKPPKLSGRYYTIIRNFFAFTANSNFPSVRRYLILSDFEGGVMSWVGSDILFWRNPINYYLLFNEV